MYNTIGAEYKQTGCEYMSFVEINERNGKENEKEKREKANVVSWKGGVMIVAKQ